MQCARNSSPRSGHSVAAWRSPANHSLYIQDTPPPRIFRHRKVAKRVASCWHKIREGASPGQTPAALARLKRGSSRWEMQGAGGALTEGSFQPLHPAGQALPAPLKSIKNVAKLASIGREKKTPKTMILIGPSPKNGLSATFGTRRSIYSIDSPD